MRDNSWAFPLINNWLHAKHDHDQELGLPMFRGSIRVFGDHWWAWTVSRYLSRVLFVFTRAVQTRQPAIRVDLSFFSIYWKFKMWASKRPKQSLPVDGEGNMLTDSWVSTEPQPSPAQPLFPHLNHAATNRRIVFFNSNHNCWNIMHLCTSSFQSITGKFEADKAALRTYFVTIKASYLLPLVTAHSASSKLVDLRYGSTFYWIKYPHGWQNAHTGPWRLCSAAPCGGGHATDTVWGHCCCCCCWLPILTFHEFHDSITNIKCSYVFLMPAQTVSNF